MGAAILEFNETFQWFWTLTVLFSETRTNLQKMAHSALEWSVLFQTSPKLFILKLAPLHETIRHVRETLPSVGIRCCCCSFTYWVFVVSRCCFLQPSGDVFLFSFGRAEGLTRLQQCWKRYAHKNTTGTGNDSRKRRFVSCSGASFRITPKLLFNLTQAKLQV